MELRKRITAGKYECVVPYGSSPEQRVRYRDASWEAQNQFNADAIIYLVEMGVPEQYADKVYNFAWQEGHSSGYSEVVNYLDMLAEIFN